MKKFMKVTVILVIAAMLAGVLSACFLFGKSRTAKDGKQLDIKALTEYAEYLKGSGMEDAAGRIYELMAQATGSVISDAHGEIPILGAADEIDMLNELFGAAKGGDVQ